MSCLRTTVDSTGASEVVSAPGRTPAEVWLFNGATAIEWSDDAAFVFGQGIPLAASAQVGPLSIPAGGRLYAATASGTSVLNAYVGADV